MRLLGYAAAERTLYGVAGLRGATSMPVTPALLFKLRETLGEGAASELVTWVERSSDRDLAELRRFVVSCDARLGALEQRLTETRAELRVEIAAQRSDIIKWMFIFWAGTIIPLAALMVALIKL